MAQLLSAKFALIDGSSAFGDAEQGVRVIEPFVAGLNLGSEQPTTTLGGLSSRELEVLRLLATGRSNAQIADDLVISQNTVIRHVSNIFAKTGAANRAQAAVYAKDHGLA
jgi:DNA-binding NarL/FixJ family response regulator